MGLASLEPQTDARAPHTFHARQNKAMSRQRLSPKAKAAATAQLNEHIRKACERMERRMERRKVLVGVLAELDEQPREA